MQELLTYMLKNMIKGPVEITEENQEGFIVYKVSVPQDQIGMVIGKGGKTINALKNILKIRAIKEDVRIDIQIQEA